MKKIILTVITLFIVTGCVILEPILTPKMEHVYDTNDHVISFGVTDDNWGYVVFVGEKYLYLIRDKRFKEKFHSKNLKKFYVNEKEFSIKQEHNQYVRSSYYILEELVIYDENNSPEAFENLRVEIAKNKEKNNVPQEYRLKENIKINIYRSREKPGIENTLKEVGVILTFPILIFGLKV